MHAMRLNQPHQVFLDYTQLYRVHEEEDICMP